MSSALSSGGPQTERRVGRNIKPLNTPMMIMKRYILKKYNRYSWEGAADRTMIPRNFVVAIPINTEAPISLRAFLALSILVPFCLMKLIPMWLQNSTPKPRLVIKLITKTPFHSMG